MYRRPPNPNFKIFYWLFDRRLLSGGRNLYLESVGWNDDSRRLACSQRHLRDLSLRSMLCFFEQDRHSLNLLLSLSSYSSNRGGPTLSSLLLMNGSWLTGGVFCSGILGVALLAGPLNPCCVRVGEIRSSVCGRFFEDWKLL